MNHGPFPASSQLPEGSGSGSLAVAGESHVCAWVPGGAGGGPGDLLKGSRCPPGPSRVLSWPCCRSVLTRAKPHCSTSPWENNADG